MAQTRRQQIVELITISEWSFDDLRHELALTVKVLEEDLRHIERSARALGQKFQIPRVVPRLWLRIYEDGPPPARPVSNLPRSPH